MGKSKKFKIIWWPWLAITAIVIGIPYVVYKIWGNGPTIDWVGFWSNYAGAFLGGLASLVALYITYKQNEFQHETTREEMHEQNRLDVLPFIAQSWTQVDLNQPNEGKMLFLPGDTSVFRNASHIAIQFNQFLSSEQTIMKNVIRVTFRNVGKGTAVNCKLACEGKKHAAVLPDLFSKENFLFYVLFPLEGGIFDFTLQYDDVQSRRYQQKISMEYGYEDLNDKEGTAYLRISEAFVPNWINRKGFN